MSTLTNYLTSSPATGHLRPFDVRRDLGPVADLVERCFADTLDAEGERYLQQMRSAANNPTFMRWAAAAAEWASIPLSGYVWEEAGKLVGNISLIPFNVLGQRFYLIANVAVHPNYRRQGIARSLTIQSIKHSRQRGAPATWLHVREGNVAAIDLYRSLGFVERARRTTWHSQPGAPPAVLAPQINIVSRSSQHWKNQQVWLRAAYPPEVTWHLQINFKSLRPGLVGALLRMVNSSPIRQWSAVRQGELLGVLTWQSNRGFADNLWLAAPTQPRDPALSNEAISALLAYARQHLSPRKLLTLDYPAHQASEVIQPAGFREHQTLIWMSLSLASGVTVP
jgi:ribosomal protein S18 acetylase RimI-like enzyme